MKKFFNCCYLMLLASMMSWIISDKLYDDARVARYDNAQARVEREFEVVVATREAQEYAAPIVQLSEQLASENAMFTEVIDRARALVIDKEAELTQTKEALKDSIELLQDQITENNRCVDEIRELERLVYLLMEKIPEGDRPNYTPDGGFDPLYNH
jgi:hypothetical protein